MRKSQQMIWQPGTVLHMCNPRTQEAETGATLGVQGLSGLMRNYLKTPLKESVVNWSG